MKLPKLPDIDRMKVTADGVTVWEWLCYSQKELKAYGEACARAALEEAARVIDQAKPRGGRAWTMEQVACFDALDHCANFIRAIEVTQ